MARDEAELAKMRDDLEFHVKRLRRGAEQLDWSDEDEKRRYLDELNEAAETLDDHLASIDPGDPKPVSTEVRKEMYDCADTLWDDACGILEDL